MGCAVELASALTAAAILADAAVTPTVSEMTYNMSSGTLNHTTQPNSYVLEPQKFRVYAEAFRHNARECDRQTDRQ